jgi:uncharacterized membrane protein
VPSFDIGCIDGQARLFYPQADMRRLLQTVIAPIRIYAGHDPQVLITLLRCMKNALHGDPSDRQLDALYEEIHALRDEADAKVENQRDRRAINEELERLAQIQGMQWEARPRAELLPLI